MNCKTIVGIAACVFVPALASAQTGIALGPDLSLHLTGDAQVRWDDNVRLAAEGDSSDLAWVFTPGLELSYLGGLSKGTLTVTEEITSYDDLAHRIYEDELFSAVGRYSYEGALTKVTAQAGYRELNQGSMTMRNREQAVRHTVSNASVDGLWSATAKTRIGAGFGYNAIDYPESALADSVNVTVPLDFYYAATPKVDVSVGYRYRATYIWERGTAPSADSKDHFFNVGAKGEFTPKLNGQFRVGYGMRNPEVGETTGQLGFSGALTYVYSPKASFDLTVSNDFNNSGLGTSQKVLSFGASGRFAFTPQWSAGMGLSYEMSDYAAVPGVTPSVRREDEFFVGNASVVYALDEVISFYAMYAHRENSSNRSGLGFNSNILSFGASLRY